VEIREQAKQPDAERDVEARKTELPPLVLDAVRAGRVREVVSGVNVPGFELRVFDARDARRGGPRGTDS
jgi:hypothetical protein